MSNLAKLSNIRLYIFVTLNNVSVGNNFKNDNLINVFT